MDAPYILLLIALLALGFGSQAYVNYKLKKYASVPLETELTGAEAARQMLSSFGIGNVEIKEGGEGQDFFDPKTNSITLSPEYYDSSSVTAVAVACHEAGHAVQCAKDYAPMKVRHALVPVANVCSKLWWILFAVGIIFSFTGLIWAAIILYAGLLVFALVTMPVEFNASRRAVAYIQATGAPSYQQRGTFDVLRACALTYVASALASAIQLVYLLGRAKR